MNTSKGSPQKHKDRNTTATASYEVQRFNSSPNPEENSSLRRNASNTFDEYCIGQVETQKPSQEASLDYGNKSTIEKKIPYQSNNEYADSGAKELSINNTNSTFLKS